MNLCFSFMKFFILICLFISGWGCTSPSIKKGRGSSQNIAIDKEIRLEKRIIPKVREFPLSTEISPCDDFYAHVCDEVNKTYELRPDESNYTYSFSDSRYRLLEKKKNYFRSLKDQKIKNKRSLQFKNFYLSCMNKQSRENEEKEYVEQILVEANKIPHKKAFLEFLGKNILTSRASFLDIFHIPSVENSDRYDFAWSLSGLRRLSHRKYYQDEAVFLAYQDILAKFFQTILPEISLDEAVNRARRVAEFEKELSEIAPLPEDWRDIISRKDHEERASLLNKYPLFHLSIPFSKIPKEVKTRHVIPKAFEFVHQKLHEISLSELKDLYLVSSLYGVLDHGYQDFFNEKWVFTNTHLGGPPVRKNLEERCVMKVSQYFGHELDQALIPILFPNFNKNKFRNLVSSVKKGMIEKLNEIKWMSADGKKSAINKMKKMGQKLVMPQNNREWNFVPLKSYDEDQYIYNENLYEEAHLEKMLREIRKPVNRDKWGASPLIVNAFYNPTKNQFFMPLGILQAPFYDPNAPIHINLGAVGSVVGHEMGHAIDDNGAKYDERGSVRNWLPEKDVKKFVERGLDLKKFFENEGHNSELTQGENIADLVGIRFSYETAFPKDLDTPKELQKKREFFTQLGRVWCGKMRPKMRERRLRLDPHAQMPQRVNIPIKHIEGFQKAFRCQVGDKMYLPKEAQIHIW